MKSLSVSLLLCCAGLASADTVFTNLTNPLVAAGEDVVGTSQGKYQTVGTMFTSLSAYTLTDVVIGVSGNGAPSSTVDVELYSDKYVPAFFLRGVEYFEHEPDIDIGHLGAVTATDDAALYTVNPSSTFVLNANTDYWVNLLPADDETVVAWDQQLVTFQQALQVDGTLVSSTPEPTTAGLFGLALIGAALARRRKA